ncbi:Large extracellular alpha-helical protein [Chromobacterium vaccinii]|nr:Large extracellular alpha-helical protein [Chromobacterium vaccinii]QND90226.1 Large extracellular alpha-helical protein [Chromobacterium vaccinii]
MTGFSHLGRYDAHSRQVSGTRRTAWKRRCVELHHAPNEAKSIARRAGLSAPLPLRLRPGVPPACGADARRAANPKGFRLDIAEVFTGAHAAAGAICYHPASCKLPFPAEKIS